MSYLQIPVPSIEELKAEFDFIKEATFEGIRGVHCVESGKAGPVLGITMMTHGNELSGLATLWYFRNHYQLQGKLKCGSVVFVLNNIKAAEAYFAALLIPDETEREAKKRRARYWDINFNRIPENTFELIGDLRYEIQRAQVLRPIWESFNAGLDIHSTSRKSDPMIIVCGGFRAELIRGFPIDIIITDIERIQLGRPAVSFYGVPEKTALIAIEAGSQGDDSALVRAIDCTHILMSNLEMISVPDYGHVSPREYREYQVCGSVILPTTSYQMAKVFTSFEPIQKGTVLAYGNGTEIVAQDDGHGLLGSPRLKPELPGEEMMFLSRPVRTITL